MCGVVATDGDDLASRDHRCQQPNSVEVLTLPRQLDHHGHRIAGQDRHGVGIAPTVLRKFDDSVLRVSASGETGNAHRASLAIPSGRIARRRAEEEGADTLYRLRATTK